MKVRIALAGMLVLLSAFALPAQGRDRVRVKDGTVVTDRGSLLRGAYAALDRRFDRTPTEEEVEALRHLGLNAIHLYAENPWHKPKAGYNLEETDKMVAWTRKHGLYLIITPSGWTAEDESTHAFFRDFWTLYASRYKDEKHVIYEICNEPGETPFDEAVLAMERDLYSLIRKLAPRTHVILLSAYNLHYPRYLDDIRRLGPGIDWANASVGGHGYHASSTLAARSIQAVKKSGYAILVTEFQALENRYANSALIRVLEENATSYLNFVDMRDVLNKPILYKDVIRAGGIRWKPDFGTWPETNPAPPAGNPYECRRAAFCDASLGWRNRVDKSVIEWVEDGGWVAYYRMDFGGGASGFRALCSSATKGGWIDIRFGSPDGPVGGSCRISATGTFPDDWDRYDWFQCALAATPKGIQDVYLTFRGLGDAWLFNVMLVEFEQR